MPKEKLRFDNFSDPDLLDERDVRERPARLLPRKGVLRRVGCSYTTVKPI